MASAFSQMAASARNGLIIMGSAPRENALGNAALLVPGVRDGMTALESFFSGTSALMKAPPPLERADSIK